MIPILYLRLSFARKQERIINTRERKNKWLHKGTIAPVNQEMSRTNFNPRRPPDMTFFFFDEVIYCIKGIKKMQKITIESLANWLGQKTYSRALSLPSAKISGY